MTTSHSYRSRVRVAWHYACLAIVLVMLSSNLTPAYAAASLSITPITWNMIGLDSNKVTAGPDTFLVGARVCNTGDVAVTDVVSNFIWDSTNVYINLGGASTLSVPSLAVGSCTDFYYNAVITRDSAAWNTTRRYHITATASGLATISTPTPRELYVEKLVSQNRNSVTGISGPSTVYVGGVYQYTVVGKTATGGYEQLETFINFPNLIFQVLAVSSTYASPTNATNDKIYADACGWTNDPASTYYHNNLECSDPAVSDGYSGSKAGGDPISTTYTVKILSPGTANLTTMIYDYSGSSYHYNSDFGTGVNAVTLTALPQADLSISKVAASDPVLAGTNLTYALRVTNNGPSPATGVTISDPLPASTPLVSATPSQGACSGTTTLSCSIGNLASGSSATVTLVVKTSSAGMLVNTATVSGNEMDLYTANNSATSTSAVSLLDTVCASPGKDGPGGTLSGSVNTYYPGTASVSAGATSLTLGASVGSSTQIATGDLLLVIQMQDSSLDTSNDERYGDGTGTAGITTGTGSGTTNINNVGRYEYVVATSAIASNTVAIRGAGPGGGLLYSYADVNASNSQPRKRFQVVRVPQYSSASLGSSLVATPWNGTAGGILALDVAGTLTLNGATVSTDGSGFRGAGGKVLTGVSGTASTDYRALSTLNGASHASKGEGTVSTPRYTLTNSTGHVVDNTAEGYPNGFLGRGAPGTAGGGGNDGNPLRNDYNSGGGGGANGGNGGQGGNAAVSRLPIGGFGGAAFPATPNRVVLGGGGGAGVTNAGTGMPWDGPASSGAGGGGIVMIRTASVSGTGTINANGANGNTTAATDGSGGGGAGGSVMVQTFSGTLSGLTVNAKGGTGGSNSGGGLLFGPGGGGGGGYVALSSSATAISVAGGSSGTTAGGSTFGATAGGAGVSTTALVPSQIPGVRSGATCAPALTVTKTTSTPNVLNTASGASATYTISVANAANMSTASSVSIADTLPTGFTYASTGSVTMAGGATRAAISDPAAGATTPSWGTFSIPGGGTVQITFTTAIAAGTSGTIQNPATATYLDPARTTSSGTTSAAYSSASSTGEDVVLALPSTVTGRAFVDMNANGVRNTGDSDLINVTVQLLNSSGAPIATTTTNASGQYTFSNVAPGSYSVKVAVPSDYKLSPQDQGGNDAVDSDVNASGVSATFIVVSASTTTLDAGLYKPGVVGGTVFVDTDRDGVHDSSEDGLSNVQLRVFGVGVDGVAGTGDDTLITTTTTGTEGNYAVSGVDPGTYYVDVVNGSVPSGFTITTGTSDPSGTFTITSGSSNSSIDFGYVVSSASTGVIGDLIWSDANANGVRDSSEVGIGGVTVALKGAGSDGIVGTADDPTVATTTTAADGSYRFTSVSPGEYRVIVTDTGNTLSGYSLTSGAQSSTNPSVPLTVTAGSASLDIDFGYRNRSLFTITDSVWYDANGDGSNDGTELGISGVVVNLVDSLGNIIATTTSDTNGAISFTGVPNGSYKLVIAAPVGYVATTASATAGQASVIVSGASVTGSSFGYNRPNTIGTYVWSDVNGNGRMDVGEPGLRNVTVQLYRDTNNDGLLNTATDTLVATTATGADGSYLFSGLASGAYFVSVDTTQSLLAGAMLTTSDQDTAAGAQYEVALASGSSERWANFGFRNNALADITGTIWNDLDRDARNEVGEPGIAGVTVALLDSNGVVVATTTTDSSGNYRFRDLQAGSYTVHVTDTTGVLSGYQLTSGIEPHAVTITGTTSVSSVDFGYARLSQTATIGDLIWMDADRDGVQDAGEGGISNVRLMLNQPGTDGLIGTADDITVGSTTSDANGRYTFSGLAAGLYYVIVDRTTLPTGLTTSAGSSDPSRLIALSDGEHYYDADFGYRSASNSAIGDRVWYDADGDGIQDAGEIGIGGVTITVSNGSGFSAQVTTDADGSWLLTNLPAGTYTVAVNPASLPTGMSTTPTNGVLNRTIVVPGGQDVLFADFGFSGGTTGSIGDLVYNDLDGNRSPGAGEPGIANVTLDLIGAGADGVFGTSDDVILATTTTGAGGAYTFSGLTLNQTYRVAVTDRNNVLAGMNLTTTSIPTTSYTPTSGSPAIAGADFGYSAATPQTGTIGDLIWHDADGDGVLDAGEPGLQGVTINLYQDSNGNGVIDPGIDNLIRTATTDAAGHYAFAGLYAGNYIVDVTDVSGVLAGMMRTTGAANTDGNSQVEPYTVTLSSESSTGTADFGYYSTSGHTISGLTFEDNDNNGAYASGTDGLFAGVTLYLYRDLDGDGVIDAGDPLVATTVSSATDGTFTFSNLPDGRYIIDADSNSSRLSGLYQTTQTATGGVQPVLIGGSNVAGQNFGFFGPTAPTAVTLLSFTAGDTATGIELRWVTATEYNTAGFHLVRSETGRRESAHQITSELIPSQGDGAQGATYMWVDRMAQPGVTYTYWLVEQEIGGAHNEYGPATASLRSAEVTSRLMLPLVVR